MEIIIELYDYMGEYIGNIVTNKNIPPVENLSIYLNGIKDSEIFRYTGSRLAMYENDTSQLIHRYHSKTEKLNKELLVKALPTIKF
jgi:hypothetical protein